WSTAGIQGEIQVRGFWKAAFKDCFIEPTWDPLLGDRKVEIVFIGQNLQKAKLVSELAKCLVSIDYDFMIQPGKLFLSPYGFDVLYSRMEKENQLEEDNLQIASRFRNNESHSHSHEHE